MSPCPRHPPAASDDKAGVGISRAPGENDFFNLKSFHGPGAWFRRFDPAFPPAAFFNFTRKNGFHDVSTAQVLAKNRSSFRLRILFFHSLFRPVKESKFLWTPRV
ncbi:MAG: hypothetical protein LBG65_01825 [Puniceicoccales bacterium]|jgi:hypothetical protein|nr:hypothetical protein [Puniceicoccales bacterium]